MEDAGGKGFDGTGRRAKFSFEKFFVTMEETFQSETISHIELSLDENEDITLYEISQSHDLVAITTNCQNLYIFSLVDMHANFLKKQASEEKKNFENIRNKLEVVQS